MDEYHCHAYPHISASVSEIPFCSHNDQPFNVEFEYIDMYVLNARKFRTECHTTYHRFRNISKEDMMREATIVSWLSDMGVPSDAHKIVVANVLECARGMADNNTTQAEVLSMRVEVVITRASEDETSDDEEEEEENDDDFEEEEEEGEGEDHGLVPAARSVVEGLETIQQKGSIKRRCAICFEDFLVGVRMPCLHMFHKNCIADWLRVGNSCPLCRFQY